MIIVSVPCHDVPSEANRVRQKVAAVFDWPLYDAAQDAEAAFLTYGSFPHDPRWDQRRLLAYQIEGLSVVRENCQEKGAPFSYRRGFNTVQLMNRVPMVPSTFSLHEEVEVDKVGKMIRKFLAPPALDVYNEFRLAPVDQHPLDRWVPKDWKKNPISLKEARQVLHGGIPVLEEMIVNTNLSQEKFSSLVDAAVGAWEKSPRSLVAALDLRTCTLSRNLMVDALAEKSKEKILKHQAMIRQGLVRSFDDDLGSLHSFMRDRTQEKVINPADIYGSHMGATVTRPGDHVEVVEEMKSHLRRVIRRRNKKTGYTEMVPCVVGLTGDEFAQYFAEYQQDTAEELEAEMKEIVCLSQQSEVRITRVIKPISQRRSVRYWYPSFAVPFTLPVYHPILTDRKQRIPFNELCVVGKGMQLQWEEQEHRFVQRTSSQKGLLFQFQKGFWRSKLRIEQELSQKLCDSEGRAFSFPRTEVHWRHIDRLVETYNSFADFDRQASLTRRYQEDCIRQLAAEKGLDYLTDQQYLHELVMMDEEVSRRASHAYMKRAIGGFRGEITKTFKRYKERKELGYRRQETLQKGMVASHEHFERVKELFKSVNDKVATKEGMDWHASSSSAEIGAGGLVFMEMFRELFKGSEEEIVAAEKAITDLNQSLELLSIELEDEKKKLLMSEKQRFLKEIGLKLDDEGKLVTVDDHLQLDKLPNAKQVLKTNIISGAITQLLNKTEDFRTRFLEHTEEVENADEAEFLRDVQEYNKALVEEAGPEAAAELDVGGAETTPQPSAVDPAAPPSQAAPLTDQVKRPKGKVGGKHQAKSSAKAKAASGAKKLGALMTRLKLDASSSSLDLSYENVGPRPDHTRGVPRRAAMDQFYGDLCDTSEDPEYLEAYNPDTINQSFSARSTAEGNQEGNFQSPPPIVREEAPEESETILQSGGMEGMLPGTQIPAPIFHASDVDSALRISVGETVAEEMAGQMGARLALETSLPKEPDVTEPVDESREDTTVEMDITLYPDQTTEEEASVEAFDYYAEGPPDSGSNVYVVQPINTDDEDVGESSRPAGAPSPSPSVRTPLRSSGEQSAGPLTPKGGSSKRSSTSEVVVKSEPLSATTMPMIQHIDVKKEGVKTEEFKKRKDDGDERGEEEDENSDADWPDPDHPQRARNQDPAVRLMHKQQAAQIRFRQTIKGRSEEDIRQLFHLAWLRLRDILYINKRESPLWDMDSIIRHTIREGDGQTLVHTIQAYHNWIYYCDEISKSDDRFTARERYCKLLLGYEVRLYRECLKALKQRLQDHRDFAAEVSDFGRLILAGRWMSKFLGGAEMESVDLSLKDVPFSPIRKLTINLKPVGAIQFSSELQPRGPFIGISVVAEVEEGDVLDFRTITDNDLVLVVNGISGRQFPRDSPEPIELDWIDPDELPVRPLRSSLSPTKELSREKSSIRGIMANQAVSTDVHMAEDVSQAPSSVIPSTSAPTVTTAEGMPSHLLFLESDSDDDEQQNSSEAPCLGTQVGQLQQITPLSEVVVVTGTAVVGPTSPGSDATVDYDVEVLTSEGSGQRGATASPAATLSPLGSDVPFLVSFK